MLNKSKKGNIFYKYYDIYCNSIFVYLYLCYKMKVNKNYFLNW